MEYKIIQESPNSIVIHSDVVPEWVKRASELQKIIIDYIEEHGYLDGIVIPGIKFVKPI